MWLRFLLMVVLAYLVGAITPAYLAAKLARGIDLRTFGTRNTGVSNLWHATDKKMSILLPVILFDFAKAWPVIWAAKFLGLGLWGEAAVAVAVVAGHNWPVYIRFHGGRGALSTLGIAVFMPLINGLAPWPVTVGVAIVLLGTFVIRNAPLGVALGIISLSVVSWIVREPTPLVWGYVGIALAMVACRLVQPRHDTSFSFPRLLINRLLFDRDIQDRQTWINRAYSQRASQQRKK